MDESGKDENKNKLTNPCTKIRARKDPDCQILLHFSDNLDGMIEREMRVLRTVTQLNLNIVSVTLVYTHRLAKRRIQGVLSAEREQYSPCPAES